MQRFRWLVALLFGGGCLPGCELMADPDAGRFDVSWELVSGDQETSIACPSGSTAEVFSSLDAGACPGPRCFSDCYACEDRAGTTENLPLGSYEVHVVVTESRLELCGLGRPARLAQSRTATAELSFDGHIVPLSFSFLGESGFFQATWNLSNWEGTLGCAEVEGLEGVRLTGAGEDESRAFEHVFPCHGDGTCGPQCGIAGPLPVGDYELAIDLVDENEISLLLCQGEIMETIEFGHELVELRPVRCLFESREEHHAQPTRPLSRFPSHDRLPHRQQQR